MLKASVLAGIYILSKAFGWCLVSFTIIWGLIVGFEDIYVEGFLLSLAGIFLLAVSSAARSFLDETYGGNFDG